MPQFLKVNKPKSKEMNFSQCKRAALTLFGPSGRVWQNDTEPKIQVGMDNYPGRQILGFGNDFMSALKMAAEKFNEKK